MGLAGVVGTAGGAVGGGDVGAKGMLVGGTAVAVGRGVSVGNGLGVSVGGRGVMVGTAVLVGGGGTGVFVGGTGAGVQVGGIWAAVSIVSVGGSAVGTATARVGTIVSAWHAVNKSDQASIVKAMRQMLI